MHGKSERAQLDKKKTPDHHEVFFIITVKVGRGRVWDRARWRWVRQQFGIGKGAEAKAVLGLFFTVSLLVGENIWTLGER